MRRIDGHRASLLLCLMFSSAVLAAAAPEQKPDKPTVESDGSVHVPAFVMPPSALASDEAKRNFQDFARSFASLMDPAALAAACAGSEDKPIPPGIDGAPCNPLDELLMKPGVARLRAAFPVRITPEKIGGVQTDIVEPVGGVAPKNARRVLVNLHGGGFMEGARFGGQMESIPIAHLGGIKVITVDYRMAPEHTFPAASEDVAAVYRELLKTYRPESVGLYGCSAGALLTAESVAWLQKHGLPRPGAVGMFGSGAVMGSYGDSWYLGYAVGGMSSVLPNPQDPAKINPYFDVANLNLRDPLVSPVYAPSVLRQFPPALLISGTRDLALSATIYTHAQLIKLGVDADLHVWEGVPHCSFAQPVVNPNEPESRDAWDVIVKFFDSHLGHARR